MDLEAVLPNARALLAQAPAGLVFDELRHGMASAPGSLEQRAGQLERFPAPGPAALPDQLEANSDARSARPGRRRFRPSARRPPFSSSWARCTSATATIRAPPSLSSNGRGPSIPRFRPSSASGRSKKRRFLEPRPRGRASSASEEKQEVNEIANQRCQRRLQRCAAAAAPPRAGRRAGGTGAGGARADVLGQRAACELLLATYMAGGHALLEGVPGIGKTSPGAGFFRGARGSTYSVSSSPPI